SDAAAFDQLPSPEPTPEMVALFTDECRRLLKVLEDGKLRAVTLAKMEGCTNEEIAKRQRCSIPTVERKLARIRKIWGKEPDSWAPISLAAILTMPRSTTPASASRQRGAQGGSLRSMFTSRKFPNERGPNWFASC